MTLPDTPSFRLDGRKALVAGASSGIGLGAAVALARAGAEVVLAARRAEALDAAVADLVAEGCAASALALDVTDLDATAAAVAREGPFDILVNSAGMNIPQPALDVSTENFDAVMEVNVRAAFFLAQAVAKGLVEVGKPGSLITISSQMGHVGGIDRAVYCASKFAVEGFTKAMAVELGPKGIRVNTVGPTFVRTPLTESTFDNPERVKWIEEKIKLGRVGTVGDVAGAVLYLASDAASLVTGTAVLVDGGWTAD